MPKKKQKVIVKPTEDEQEGVGVPGLFPVQSSDILEEMEGNEAYHIYQRERNQDFS